MEEWIYIYIYGWMYILIDEWVDGSMAGWMDGCVDVRMYAWLNEWMGILMNGRRECVDWYIDVWLYVCMDE